MHIVPRYPTAPAMDGDRGERIADSNRDTALSLPTATPTARSPIVAHTADGSLHATRGFATGRHICFTPLAEQKEGCERKAIKGFVQTNFARFILTFAIAKTQNGGEITNVGSAHRCGMCRAGFQKEKRPNDD
jgi:hypothetical protein